MTIQNHDSSKLQLVSFRKELFPVKPSDYEILRENGVTVSRIQTDILPLLQRSLLKGIKIQVFPWVDVYELLVDHFIAHLPKPTYECIHEENWILINTDSIDKPDRQKLESRISQLTHYAGRYGFRVRFEHKEKKDKGSDYTLTRIVFLADPNMIPSFYFGSGESEDSTINFEFSLSPACRIRFLKRKSPAGVQSFTTIFEDKVGDTWVENTSRSFNFNYLKESDCRQAIGFFSHLISLIHPNKRNPSV